MNFLMPTKHTRLNEGIALVLFTLTLLILLSLISYHPTDPSFNVSRNSISDSTVQNVFGRFGSTLADLLLQTLGYPAFLLPIFFFHLRMEMVPFAEDCKPMGQSFWSCFFDRFNLYPLGSPYPSLLESGLVFKSRWRCRLSPFRLV
jgi:hypothetical protein